MNTKILPASAQSLPEVKKQFQKHNPVALPTETVYGLAAPFEDELAVNNIYEVKNRPASNPLIVHIATLEQLDELADEVLPKAKQLAQTFWPGPLTIIVKATKRGKPARAGLNTMAVRMPDNNFFLEAIKQNGPLCAPSANTSGKPSPTTAQHVPQDLNGKIALIVDGGECREGMESTVVDCTQRPFKILRLGAISQEELGLQLADNKEQKSRSPGTRFKHYSPKAKVVATNNPKQTRAELEGSVFEISMRREAERQYADNKELAKNYYGWLREADKQGAKTVLVERVAKQGIGETVNERIDRATHNDNLE